MFLNIAKNFKSLRCGCGAFTFIFSIYLKPVLYIRRCKYRIKSPLLTIHFLSYQNQILYQYLTNKCSIDFVDTITIESWEVPVTLERAVYAASSISRVCLQSWQLLDTSFTVYKPVRSTASIKRKLWAPVLTINALLMQLTVQVYTPWVWIGLCIRYYFTKQKKNIFNVSLNFF